jgi:hypothetical protein
MCEKILYGTSKPLASHWRKMSVMRASLPAASPKGSFRRKSIIHPSSEPVWIRTHPNIIHHGVTFNNIQPLSLSLEPRSFVALELTLVDSIVFCVQSP